MEPFFLKIYLIITQVDKYIIFFYTVRVFVVCETFSLPHVMEDPPIVKAPWQLPTLPALESVPVHSIQLTEHAQALAGWLAG